MTPEETLVCEHGLSASDLSAYHDGDLPDTEQTRVGAHLATCPAARAHLADYETLIAALRAQRVPTADPRLWQAVSARVAATPVRPNVLHRHPLAVGIGTLGTLAALLALVLGFARLFVPGPPTTPASLRSWDPVTFPRGFTLDNGSLAVVDGNTAYACVTAYDQHQNQKPTVSGPATQFWVTHTRGAAWQRLADLPLIGTNQCNVTVDGLDPNVVTAWGRSIPLHAGGLAVYTHTSSANPSSGAAVTYDGGSTWQPTDRTIGPHDTTHDATGDITYAIVSGGSGPALQVSRDHMATWQPVDDAIAAAQQQVTGLLLGGSAGPLLVTTTDTPLTTPSQQYLWESTDGGAHWREMVNPANVIPSTYIVRQPQSGGPFDICTELYPLASTPATPVATPAGLACSIDSGQTWGTLALPPASSCLSPTTEPRLQPLTLNGDLYMDDGGCTDTLYRYPFTGDAWAPILAAPLPQLDLNYYPATGAVWTMPRITDAYTQVDPTGHIYTRQIAS